MTKEEIKSVISRFFVIFAVVVIFIGYLFPNFPGPEALKNSFVISLAILIFYHLADIIYHYLSIGRWTNKSHHLFSGLIQPKFRLWQQKIFEELYSELEFASVYGKRYPAAVLRPANSLVYPFDGLCNLQTTKLPIFEFDRNQKNYLKILGKSMRAPKMKGYALSRMHFNEDGKIKSFDAITTNQEQNIVTCHILEWELFNYYHRSKGAYPENVLNYLPYRSRYHNGRNGILAISEPNSAYPLISVQAVVIFKDTKRGGDPKWRVVLAKRSKEVIVKPGFFQLQPAGGFEVFGSQSDNDDFLVKKGFNIADALLREYAEELFNVEEFQENSMGRDPFSIRSHPVVKQLVEAINRETAWIEFIGTVIDLTVLRPELSFLILIEDDFFCNSSILGSWESKNIMCPEIDELETILSTNTFHGSSAGLLQLAIENKRIQELGIAKSIIGHGKL